MSKLDKVLDEVIELSWHEKEMLANILHRRLMENNRQQIADDARISLQEFQQGQYSIQ